MPAKKDDRKSSFWSTMPGLITAIAGLITAVGGLITVLYASGVLKPSPTATVTAVLPTITFSPVTNSPAPLLPPTVTQATAPIATELPPDITDAKNVPMVLVPEGEFMMGAVRGDSKAEVDEKPVHLVNLGTYYIDEFEVTNALYKVCVDTGKCDQPKYISLFTTSPSSVYYGNSQYGQYPVVYVDWYMAKTYCETWRGARLPTEAEWEKAARGTDQRMYPWGQELDCQKANYSNCHVDGTSKVDSHRSGQSPYGVYDMAGNVWEWVADWYSKTYYATLPLSNPLGPELGQGRVMRGGSWTGSDIRSSNRLSFSPDYNNFNIGFRCARSP